MIFNSPGFKKSITAKILTQNKTILLDQKNLRHLLEGKIYSILAPYLAQGIYSIDQLVEMLSECASAPEIHFALLRLHEKGFLE